MLKYLRSLFRVLKSRDRFEQDMGEELRFHIAEYTDELVRSGVTPQEAARRARIEFGSVVTVQEDCREARGLYLVDELVRQIRHAYRLLRKTPKFTATALATLAICLGANLTIFAVVDAILLRPLPFPEAGRLVTIFNTYPKAGVDRDGSSIANYYERRGQIPAFESLSLYSFGTAVIGEPGATEREQIVRVSPEFFSTLGAGPAIGRTFREEETSFETDGEVILSDAYWRKYFNADPSVIGKQVRVNGIANTVIGVLPPDFRFLSSEACLYFPYATRVEDRASSQRHSGGNSRQLIARLKPGATIEQAQAQIDAQNTALEVNNPEAKMMAEAGFRSPVVPLHADHVASIRPTLLWIQAGAIALLLIGAVNLTNLLLIRANSRAKEMAVRQALGASRSHVVSEVLVETTLLTLSGGLLGLIVGAIGIRLLSVLGADRLPLGSNIIFETRSALVVLLGSLLLGLAVAVPIAWFNLQGHRMNAMQAESRGGTSNRAAQGLRHAFIVGQIALALVLLSGAALLGLSLERTMKVSPGFRADHVLTGQISLPWSKYPDWNERRRFNEMLLQQIRRQPGVSSAGIINNVPLSGKNGKSATAVKGHVARPGESARANYSYGVDGDYFSAMGFNLREGRFLTADDSRRTERVCVVDEDFARYYWPEGNAVGQRLFSGSQETKDADAFTVVGVVGAVKQAGLTDRETLGAVYYPYALRTDDDLFVVVRANVSPESFAMTLQGIVRKIDSDLPLNDVRSMDTRITDSLVANRAAAMLAGIFSVIALLLTAVGTYGVVGYAVEQRRREIGVRMVLGAQPEHIRAQFLTLAMRLLAAGIVLGSIGAWLTGQAMRTLLFDVPSFHVATFAASTCVIGLVSLIACLLPSRRAARISPVEALAGES
jgi:predicted permease